MSAQEHEIEADRSTLTGSVAVIDIGGTHVRCGGSRSGTVLGEVRQFSTDVFLTGNPGRIGSYSSAKRGSTLRLRADRLLRSLRKWSAARCLVQTIRSPDWPLVR